VRANARHDPLRLLRRHAARVGILASTRFRPSRYLLRLRLAAARHPSRLWRETVQDAGPGLAGALLPLRRRADVDGAIRAALSALACWAGATALVVAWSKLSPVGGTLALAVALGAVSLLGAAAAWALGRPLPLEVARVADARFGLKERLASALFFAGARGVPDPSTMQRRLEEDAVERARQHRPAEAFPLQRHSRRAFVALTALATLAALAFTPNPQATTLARRSADRAVISEAKKAVASARRRLERAPHHGGKEGAQAEAALQRALVQLRKAGTPLQALTALSALESQLSSLPNLSAGEETAAAAAGAALAGTPGTAKLSRDLFAGDLKAAAADLRHLAQRVGELGAKEQRALAKALQQAAERAGANGAGSRFGPGQDQQQPNGGTTSSQGAFSPFTNALSQAAQALEAGKAGAASKYLGSAARGANASAASASLQQQLAAAEAALSNAQSKVASQAQADTSGRKGNLARGAAMKGGGEKGGSSSPRSATGNGQGKSGSFGSSRSVAGQGRGRGKGSGAGNKESKSKAGNGGGNGPAHKSGGGRSSAQVFVGGQPSGTEQVVGKRLANGYKVKTTNYRQVMPSFERTALQGLGSQVLSPADQDLVRNYFTSLGGQTTRGATTKKG
jgi:hypothetical protein